MEKYGRVVCAALLNNNCIYMGREGHHIIFSMEPIGILRSAKQGFVTEKGYFVDRELGLQIATFYDQIEHKYNPLDKLVSEDLKKQNLQVKQTQTGYSYKEKQKGIIMKNYDREEVIYEIISLLKYHSDNKNCLKLANLLINKATNEKIITLSADEIKEFLFENDGINIIVLMVLKRLNADMSGINFSRKTIKGINFDGLENVSINIDEVPDKDLTNTSFSGVTLVGTLDNAKIGNTNFNGYIGELELDPQKVKDKTLSGSKLAGITITGTLDNVIIKGVDFTDAKGDIKVNPQKVPERQLMGINFSGVEFCGDTDEDEPSFDNCTIYDSKFRNIKNKITINLDTINSSLFPKLAICDITGVTIVGNAKSNYEAKHCVREDGRVIFEDVNDDLYGCYYYDEKGDYVHVHLFLSMKWDTKNSNWIYLTREEEPNLQISVEFKEKEKKPKVKQKLINRWIKKIFD